MGITKYSSGGIPSIGPWTNLADLEPAIEGLQRRVSIPGSSRSGYALAQRFSDKWDIVGADATSINYMTANQIPAPEYNPFRSHIYLGPAAAELIAEEATTVISTAMIFTYITVQPLTWTRVRLWMANIDGTPVTPDGIWFALCEGGYADNPFVVGSWVSASSLVGPPAGTDDSPGIGPVCAYATLGGSSATQTIALRIQMPAGTYTRMPYGIGTAAAITIPEWSPFVYEKTSDISASPGTTSGWENAFGKIPHFWLEVDGLSQQQCLLGCVGDSHTRGYLSDLGGSGYRGMFGEIMDLKGTSRVSLVNFGRAGHTTSQISSRLHAIETQMDLGGWLRQRASINDRDGSFDYTIGTANLAYSQLQSDYSFINGLGKLLIPFQGFGMDGASGWYERFNTHLSEELAAYPWSITTADTILDTVGAYDATMGGSDDAHPSILGYQTVALPTWTALQSSLVTLGVTL